MKLLYKKIFLLMIPLIFILSIMLILDPFKIIFEYDDYYGESIVNVNREYVSTKLYQKYNNEYDYNSFIFGNSRSQAYKTVEWKKYLSNNARPFHFDGSGDTIYGIANKMRFIEKNNGKIENALIILDYKTMIGTKNRKGYLFISPPELTNEPSYKYYYEFLKPLLDIKFSIGYIDYKLFNTYRFYMKNYFISTKHFSSETQETGDLWYGHDKSIAYDEDAYYIELDKRGTFDLGEILVMNKAITVEEEKLLKSISDILVKNNTNYKIIVSPLYNKIPLDENRVDILYKYFGKENVYDYSGLNEITENKYNYYESSHYRPKVANFIMKEIYAGATN